MKKSAFVVLVVVLGIIGVAGFAFFARSAKAQKPNTTMGSSQSSILLDGDIIFQSSKSGQSYAVQLATHSPYSHVGLVYIIDGSYWVYEAVQPVRLTPLSNWIHHGDGGHYIVKRLKNRDRVLTSEKVQEMKAIGKRFNGLDYDLHFGWSDDRMYCSELVWKIYHEALGIDVGQLQALRDFDLTHPVVKEIVERRYGDNVPLDETVISPAAIFASDKLVTVQEK
ncbi:YiiX family permuted papain-like enzyme [Parachryseolinea silvisoli]|uniref:YiiX family permuted papain-like enzyme n=1 Tax=Parachryseolinea silvisoli TaxID=2873601 RepID=UPI002265A9CE|nr:YiiX family permuted papain-like enzyme [Parachryseolinea silvisoli]MCD9017496.1 YiiX family permuted papain-like enzyme [Parachryseolinea silvisoli]